MVCTAYLNVHESGCLCLYMSLVTRKPVFGVCDQVRLTLACYGTEASESHEIANIENRDIILPYNGIFSRRQIFAVLSKKHDD